MNESLRSDGSKGRQTGGLDRPYRQTCCSQTSVWKQGAEFVGKIGSVEQGSKVEQEV